MYHNLVTNASLRSWPRTASQALLHSLGKHHPACSVARSNLSASTIQSAHHNSTAASSVPFTSYARMQHENATTRNVNFSSTNVCTTEFAMTMDSAGVLLPRQVHERHHRFSTAAAQSSDMQYRRINNENDDSRDDNSHMLHTDPAVASIPGNAASRRNTLRTKNPIIVTERAAAHIQELLQGDNATGAIGIRLGTRKRGCNGLSYTLNYAYPADVNDNDNNSVGSTESLAPSKKSPKKKLVAMEAYGVKVFIEPMALFNVVGTVMDWEETELSSEFTFNNPNSKGECGCGESFNV